MPRLPDTTVLDNILEHSVMSDVDDDAIADQEASWLLSQQLSLFFDDDFVFPTRD